MKKKFLSLVTGIISGAVALGLFAVAVFCITHISRVSEVIRDTTDDLGGINLIAYAGIGYFVAILGIIIAGALGCYRVMLAYYYCKIFASDEKFYDERRKGIIGFTVLALIMFIGFGVIYFWLSDIINIRFVKPVSLAFMITYGLIIFLPILEMVLSSVIKPKTKEKKEKAENLSKAKISEELTKLADETAESEVGEKSEKDEDKNV